MSVPSCSVVILVDLLAVDREDERWDEGLCVIADRPLSEGLSLLLMPSKVLPLGIIRYPLVLIRQLKRQFHISACGFFIVDRNLVTAFLATIFTYWITLVQFTQTANS